MSSNFILLLRLVTILMVLSWYQSNSYSFIYIVISKCYLYYELARNWIYIDISLIDISFY